MNITSPEISITTVKLTGSISGDQVEDLRCALGKAIAGGGNVAVDVTDVETVCVAGMAALKEAAALLEFGGSRMLLINTVPVPRAVEFKAVMSELDNESMLGNNEEPSLTIRETYDADS